MRNPRKTATVLIAVGLLAAAVRPANAQERKKTWEYGLFSGLQQFGMDGIKKDGLFVASLKADTDFVTGIRAAYAFTNHWQAEIAWDISIAPGEAPYDDLSFDFSTVQLNAIYNFRGQAIAGIDPYILVGIGINSIEVEGSRFDQQVPPNRGTVGWLPFDNQSGSVNDNSTLTMWALGLRVFGNEEFGFRFELRRKSYDIFESSTNDDEFTFGVMWRLGKELAMPEEEEQIPLDLE